MPCASAPVKPMRPRSRPQQPSTDRGNHMTTRIPTRGGLAALIFGLLIAVFVGAQFFAATSVHAQGPAATETPAAPAAAAETPPACDAKTLEKCTPNSGDTAWMLTSVALVLMMTIPGLGL